MKVLHVLEAIEGGTARHLCYVTRFVSADHVVVVPPERVGGLTDTSAFDTIERAGATIHIVPMRRSAASMHNTTAFSQVRRLIRRHRPDVVHGHSSIGGAIARVSAVGSGAARVYTPNGLFPAKSAMTVERALGHLTHKLIASSASEAERVRQERLVPDSRLVIVPNAIELGRPALAPDDVRVKLGVAPDTPIVGTVARLVPQKAPEVFVRACVLVARHAPRVRFVLVGDGPLLGAIEAEIERLGLSDRVLLLQHCTEGPGIIEQFDVFALSSRYEAGAAFAPMEAMRAGAPVVLTDVTGNRDAIEDGKSGLIVPPDSPEHLAQAINRLLDDPSLGAAFSSAARARLAERFDVRHVADDLLAVYRRAMLEARLPGPASDARLQTY